MARALVLAAGSFVGRHLCSALTAAGHEVVATARRPGGVVGARVCDLNRARQVERLVAELQPDWIVQCAGATHSRSPRALYRLHLGGARRLLSAVKRHAPAAVTVLFGSAAEYGAAPRDALPLPETYPTEPCGFFGASKLAQTHFARAAAGEWQLRVVVARPSNVVGPGLPRHYLASALAWRLRELSSEGVQRLDLPVFNGRATRDFVDVRDVALGVRLLLESCPPARGKCEVYNLSTGVETEVLEVARHLCDLAGGARPVDAGAGGSRTGIMHSCCSAEKLARACSWRPAVLLQRSLADLWAEQQAFSDHCVGS